MPLAPPAGIADQETRRLLPAKRLYRILPTRRGNALPPSHSTPYDQANDLGPPIHDEHSLSCNAFSSRLVGLG